MAKRNTKRAAVGAGALAAAAAGLAAGYYFYASKNASKNRKIAAKWATNLKNDVVKQAKKAGAINRAQMSAMVDKAAAAYESMKDLDKSEIRRAAKELKGNWDKLAKEMGIGGSATRAKRPAKKAAKKSGKKRSR